MLSTHFICIDLSLYINLDKLSSFVSYLICIDSTCYINADKLSFDLSKKEKAIMLLLPYCYIGKSYANSFPPLFPPHE